jgi:uncharacterized protein YicC (UPF0701 family)
MNITTVTDLYKEAEAIQSFLDITMSEQVEEALERGNTLACYISRTGKMVADAKYHHNTKLSSAVISILKDTAQSAGATSKAVNALIDSSCADERYLVDWLDRLNRTATHQLDWVRTVISKAKAEMMSIRQIG